MRQKIAIIGAGVAGLSCATVLQRAGMDVTVFEKSRGVSGRLSTRVVAESETTHAWQCDHGAQYFTARDPRFVTEVNRWLEAGVAQLWQPRLQTFDGETFLPKSNDTERFVGYPRNNSPAKWLAQSLQVQAETTIIGLQKNQQQWQLSTKEHGVLPQLFDDVLLAIPAPQAAVLLTEVAPALASLCASVKMQPCFALMVQLYQPLSVAFDGLFINSGLLSWIARDSAKPGRASTAKSAQETWVLHASSQWSEAHVNDDKSIVAEHILAAFLTLVNADAVAVQSHTIHRWLYADCPQYLTRGHEFDSSQHIGLCGDWLNGGKVQGAWLSGYGLAHELLQHRAR
jgi:renalase